MNSIDDFIKYTYDQKIDLTSCVSGLDRQIWKGKKQGKEKNSIMKFDPSNLTLIVNNCKQIFGIKEPIKSINSDKVTVINKNKCSSTHTFIKQSVTTNEWFNNLFPTKIIDDIGLIFIDPPFGLEAAIWDKNPFTISQYRNLLKPLLAITHPFTIVFFLTESMLHDIIPIFKDLNQWDFKIVYTYMFNKQNNPKTFGYFVTPVLLLYHSELNILIKSKFSNNLLVTFKETLLFTEDGSKVNPTQKTISLLKFLLSLKPENKNTIVDLCSGSCSVSIASACYGYDSFSLDIDKVQLSQGKARLERLVIIILVNLCPFQL